MSRTTSQQSTDPRARTAARATAVAFIGAGFAFSSWASRIPQVKGELHLSASELGLALLGIAAGSVIAMPLTGQIIHRIGSRRTTTSMALLLSVALAAGALGFLSGVVPLVAALFFFGFANGAWDVSMNVQAASVERALGRAIMSRFHAGYSIGTVGGALIGAAMVALDVPVTAHLLGVAVVVALTVPWAVQGYLPDDHSDESSPEATDGPRPGPLAAWKELRTLLIGVCVLAFAFAEGTANDWISVAMIEDYGTRPSVGTLGFATFLAAMTTARWFGPAVLQRYGRVTAVRGLAAVNLVGLLLFVFGGLTPVAFVGALLWGAGVSLGFPVGMSAGADEPRRAAARVSVISSIGYCAFLGGPPLIGFLGQNLTVLRALVAVAVLLAVAVSLAGVLRAPAGQPALGD
jgi:predicted MFS family arabinose efflux permease